MVSSLNFPLYENVFDLKDDLLTIYTPIAFDESNFLASTGWLAALCVRVCRSMRVRLRNCCMQAYAQTLQHTRTHRAVTGRVEAKKLLSH